MSQRARREKPGIPDTFRLTRLHLRGGKPTAARIMPVRTGSTRIRVYAFEFIELGIGASFARHGVVFKTVADQTGKCCNRK